MKSVKYILGGLFTAACVANAASLIPPNFDEAAANSAANPWNFFNVTFFQANQGFGASYVRFFVTNNAQNLSGGENYATTCSSVAFPSDPINGGTTPQTYTTGPLSGNCDNPNATWSWDGKQLESTYIYGSGSFNPSGVEYICTIHGFGSTNRTTLTTKTTNQGTAKVAKKIPVTSANGVC